MPIAQPYFHQLDIDTSRERAVPPDEPGHLPHLGCITQRHDSAGFGGVVSHVADGEAHQKLDRQQEGLSVQLDNLHRDIKYITLSLGRSSYLQ